MVDNASSDGSLEQAVKLFGQDPRFKVIRNSKNLGVIGSNPGAKKAKGKYLVLLNNDVVVTSNCLHEIVKVLEENEDIGAAQPKILFLNNPQKIDNVGNLMDVSGFAIGRGTHEIDVGQYDRMEEIFAACGAAMVVRQKIVDEIGLYDPTYFMNYEDADFCWRIRLRGYKIVMIPKAIVYHKAAATTSRYYSPIILWHMRKNRMTTLIKNYATKNLLKIMPVVLLIYLLIFFKEALVEKKSRYAITSLSAILYNLKESKKIIQKRMIVQNQIRRVPDEKILSLIKPPLISQKPLLEYIKNLRKLS